MESVIDEPDTDNLAWAHKQSWGLWIPNCFRDFSLKSHFADWKQW